MECVIGLRGCVAAEGSVGPVMVVVVDEFVDQLLEFLQSVSWRLLSQPFLHGLLKPFDFPAGCGMSWGGVLLTNSLFS